MTTHPAEPLELPPRKPPILTPKPVLSTPTEGGQPPVENGDFHRKLERFKHLSKATTEDGGPTDQREVFQTQTIRRRSKTKSRENKNCERLNVSPVRRRPSQPGPRRTCQDGVKKRSESDSSGGSSVASVKKRSESDSDYRPSAAPEMGDRWQRTENVIDSLTQELAERGRKSKQATLRKKPVPPPKKVALTSSGELPTGTVLSAEGVDLIPKVSNNVQLYTPNHARNVPKGRTIVKDQTGVKDGNASGSSRSSVVQDLESNRTTDNTAPPHSSEDKVVLRQKKGPKPSPKPAQRKTIGPVPKTDDRSTLQNGGRENAKSELGVLAQDNFTDKNQDVLRARELDGGPYQQMQGHSKGGATVPFSPKGDEGMGRNVISTVIQNGERTRKLKMFPKPKPKAQIVSVNNSGVDSTSSPAHSMDKAVGKEHKESSIPVVAPKLSEVTASGGTDRLHEQVEERPAQNEQRIPPVSEISTQETPEEVEFTVPSRHTTQGQNPAALSGTQVVQIRPKPAPSLEEDDEASPKRISVLDMVGNFESKSTTKTLGRISKKKKKPVGLGLRNVSHAPFDKARSGLTRRLSRSLGNINEVSHSDEWGQRFNAGVTQAWVRPKPKSKTPDFESDCRKEEKLVMSGAAKLEDVLQERVDEPKPSVTPLEEMPVKLSRTFVQETYDTPSPTVNAGAPHKQALRPPTVVSETHESFEPPSIVSHSPEALIEPSAVFVQETYDTPGPPLNCTTTNEGEPCKQALRPPSVISQTHETFEPTTIVSYTQAALQPPANVSQPNTSPPQPPLQPPYQTPSHPPPTEEAPKVILRDKSRRTLPHSHRINRKASIDRPGYAPPRPPPQPSEIMQYKIPLNNNPHNRNSVIELPSSRPPTRKHSRPKSDSSFIGGTVYATPSIDIDPISKHSYHVLENHNSLPIDNTPIFGQRIPSNTLEDEGGYAIPGSHLWGVHSVPGLSSFTALPPTERPRAASADSCPRSNNNAVPLGVHGYTEPTQPEAAVTVKERNFMPLRGGGAFPSNTLKGRTFPSNTLKGRTFPSNSLKGRTLPSDRLKGRTFPSNTLKMRRKIHEAFKSKSRTEEDTASVTSEDSEVDDAITEQRLSAVRRMKARTSHYCSLEQARKVGQFAKLYEYVVVVSLKYDQEQRRYEPCEIKRFPEEVSDSQNDKLRAIPHFCFPDSFKWAPVESYNSETFSFVLTSFDGSRFYGYNRRLLPPGEGARLPEVFCVMSPVACYPVYYQLLDEIEKRRKHSMDEVVVLLKAAYDTQLPRPGSHVRVSANLMSQLSVKEPLFLQRPQDSRLEQIDFDYLFKCISIPHVLQIFGSLLLERRIVMFSSYLSKLSKCSQAIAALLYPFAWQHVYVPVLPMKLLDMCCSPTPYIMGMLSLSIPELEDMPLDQVLIVNLDAGEFDVHVGDEGTILPKRLYLGLEKALKTCLKENDAIESRQVENELSEDCETRNKSISEAFIVYFVELMGHYLQHFQESVTGGLVFDRDGFLKGTTSKSGKRFLEVFTETQMFSLFIQEKEANSEEGLPQTLFDQRIQSYESERRNSKLLGVVNVKKIGQKITSTAKGVKGKVLQEKI